MLELDDLTKRYNGVVALDGCSLEVPRGRMLGFLGPNGAGKTTAMRSVFGLVTLERGCAAWDGNPIGREEMLGFGYMPEERGLYPRMNVLDQVTYFGRLHGMERGAARSRSGDLLDELGLTARLDADVQSLSHGNQQRVQLAVALIHDPLLLVLDEPFSGLDPVAAETMAAVLKRLAAGGAAVLFSSHQLDVVEHLCRDVAIIDGGRVVLSGRVDELRAASPRRYVDVVVRGADAGWADSLRGAVVESRDGDRTRLELAGDGDAGEIFELATRSGELIEFSFAPPPLSEVFREVVRR